MTDWPFSFSPLPCRFSGIAYGHAFTLRDGPVVPSLRASIVNAGDV